ncbi:MAG: hypothetical protein ABGY72_20045 [bacterium]
MRPEPPPRQISALTAGASDGGPRLIARDKATGEIVGSVNLPAGALGSHAGRGARRIREEWVMRKRGGGSMVCKVMLGAALGLVTSVVAAPLALAQAESYVAPRLPGTDDPDLSGIWQAFTTANWDLEDHSAEAGPLHRQLGMWGAQPPGQSVVLGGEIPYRPDALARRNQNLADRLVVDHDNINTVGDPETKCYLPGVPRATYMPFPFQIIQSTNRLVVAYQFASASRTIPIDGTSEAPVDSWMGWSNGRWDGDSLVVETAGFNGLAWFDRAGNYHSAALRVEERYTPMSPYHLMYEATITDPEVFTRPWTIRFPLYRRIEDNLRLLEFKCVDLAEEYVYGGLVDEEGGAR